MECCFRGQKRVHRVKIHQGHITQLKVDITVNAADYGLTVGNGVSSAIRCEAPRIQIGGKYNYSHSRASMAGR